MAVMEDYHGFYGLGFFAFLVLFLYRLGFFQNKKILKLFLTIAIFYVLEIFSATRAGKPILAAFFPVFFMSIFLLFLYFAYEEKLMVYLKEPKPVISLAARGFTPLEASYIFAVIEGKTAKEMAYEMQVSESTARNNIARSFHKLGLNDRHEFTILSMKNDIVA
jgi:DNA-binding CsgD family transcriptional regulator